MTTFLDSFHEGELIPLLNLSLFLGYWLQVLRFDPKFINPGERLNLLASLVAQMVKNLPAMWETQVQSLGWEDTLEKEMANLPGESHGQRSLVGYSPWSHKQLDMTE